VDGADVVGYAYAGKWKTRAAYRHSVEVSVYVSPERHGRGIGRQLYAELLRRLRERDVHSVIGGVAGNNAASFALHLSFGFEQVAHFREVGHKFGQWIDVTYFQLLLPREPEN
jgi:phosphinothricin acetyltransferase